MTEEVLSCLCHSGSTATLQKLYLFYSANFDLAGACMHLATLIDTAICLKKLRIRLQQGKRRVLVDIEYAVAASGDAHLADAPKQGCITIKVKDDNRVICEVPTAKTASQEVEIQQL